MNNIEMSEELDADNELESHIRKLKKIKEDLCPLTETDAVVQYDAKEIIQKLDKYLTIKFDTNFLTDYYKILNSNDTVIIKQINNTIFSSMQQALRRQRSEKKPLEEADVILMAAWLSVAALCGMRPALATRTLQALLAVADEETIENIALMWRRTATAEMLLQLADTTRVDSTHASSKLADMLLRAAMLAKTAAPHAARWSERQEMAALARGALQPDEVAHELKAVHTDESLSVLCSVAARVLAGQRSDLLIKSIERAVNAAHARAGTYRLPYESTLAQVTPKTFRMLFGKKEKFKQKTRHRPKRKLE